MLCTGVFLSSICVRRSPRNSIILRHTAPPISVVPPESTIQPTSHRRRRVIAIKDVSSEKQHRQKRQTPVAHHMPTRSAFPLSLSANDGLSRLVTITRMYSTYMRIKRPCKSRPNAKIYFRIVSTNFMVIFPKPCVSARRTVGSGQERSGRAAVKFSGWGGDVRGQQAAGCGRLR